MKLIFEGMEESGSVDLDKFIEKEKDQFFAGIDCMCISGESRHRDPPVIGADLIKTTTGLTPRPQT
jgi:acetylornithine deacetylase/succinyl-diaminopimelate desuccinylase-like protein